MAKITLRTSNDVFHDLHVLCDKHKRGGRLIVDREKIMNLLMDHSAMARELGPNRVQDSEAAEIAALMS